MNIHAERIQQLRNLMKENNLHAYIVYHTDPHQSEYPINHHLERTWLTGFNGSAGTVVITRRKATLFTDARYYLQAETQLEGTQITLQKTTLPTTPTIEEWLLKELPEKANLGMNAEHITVAQYNALKTKLAAKNINITKNTSLIQKIWTENRPPLSLQPIENHPLKWSGESTTSKINKIRKHLHENNIDAYLLTALDEIAWTFNIRGRDTECNPVAIAYAYIGKKEAILYTHPKKVTPELEKELKAHHVKTAPYKRIYKKLKNGSKKQQIGYDENKTNLHIYLHIPKKQRCAISNPIPALKGIKNETEINGFKEAMVYDGVALTYFFKWLENELKQKNQVTELQAIQQLHEYRAQNEHFVEESFSTIAGFGPHGAIIHYNATEEQNAELQPNNFFLLDSGGQYHMGTTDITRTIHLGKPTVKQKKDYTLVLKANLKLAQAQFPNTTRGVQLDILARQELWEAGLDYPHGTGHGVGSYLNVHEGPQAIRTNDNGITMKEGMVTSNEPALYRENEYGIRIENLLLCTPHKDTPFGNFLQFETLTLYPFETRCINQALLTPKEKAWINSYHSKVYELLSPHLDAPTQQWLKIKCTPIKDTNQ